MSANDFVIFHPSDFSEASASAFAHALKIALHVKARLEIMHVVSRGQSPNMGPDWINFPGVRRTLARWGILPANARREEVAKTGVRVSKVLAAGSNPLESMIRRFESHRPDLIVLGTNQREGVARWMHKPVAEPLARKSRAMTLFVPRNGRGFVDPGRGNVRLRKILIPIDHNPDPQNALEIASLFAQALGTVDVQFLLLHVGIKAAMPSVENPAGPGWSFQKIVRTGDVVDMILVTEAESHADLIVLPTQGHADFLDALRGSTTDRVVRGAHCPVLAVPVQV
ncbi:MAG: universal stress protein [Deltaproteobacteria bacterium]|nr:universal stress protein [Deltaproteobacteria bacterium]